MQPFLDARFTQGMVDGGERGSSKALGTLFDELLAYVKGVRSLTRAPCRVPYAACALPPPI